MGSLGCNTYHEAMVYLDLLTCIHLHKSALLRRSRDGTNDEPVKSSKGSKKANGPDASKASASLAFKINSNVPYKTVVKGVHLLVC